ncbi:hypothetical protein GCM10011504_22420 [Siccirubricoccus deserti]|uniref:Calcineurin-like phosphoesterase domain-containing protein n=1 Tax=Siccirubricoccus deserti TaxID=2013562 RepID=A0A9X0UCV8_9PROT|nr:hypothetical protein [Siccirubricoccus deserti]MBC4015657.1 hypothetical protein [Siccirubricoccus deserti]GGC43504.1 hypothetical protein GCM10011504_22420 [Siccirubricoccus deserti]
MRLLPLLLLLALHLPAAAEPLHFVAFGDMPYCRDATPDGCATAVARVERLMATINARRPAFSIFLGDTKGGGEACTDAILLRALDWMALAAHPLVYTPGDNEWTDCWQRRAGGFDPQGRLALLRQRFFANRPHLGAGRMAVERQDSLPENARWVADGVVLLTLHIPGSNNNRPTLPGERPAITPPEGAEAEWQVRDAANQAWLAEGFAKAARIGARGVVVAIQADIFFAQVCGGGYDSGYAAIRAALATAAAGFGRPVLLLTGDSHVFVRHRPIATAPNLTRVMVPGDRDSQALVIGFDPGGPQPLRLEVIGEAGNPGERPPCAGYAPLMDSTRSG